MEMLHQMIGRKTPASQSIQAGTSSIMRQLIYTFPWTLMQWTQQQLRRGTPLPTV